MSERRDVIRGALTSVRPTTADDIELLVAWHADPEIARYWDDERVTVEELEARFARNDVHAYVVEEAGAPIGFLQAWTDDGRVGGLDMFLVPAARGRGLGPDAARAAARYYRDEVGLTRVTADPYVWNDGAIRAWQRAGFEPVGEREPDAEHTSRWLLMSFAE